MSSIQIVGPFAIDPQLYFGSYASDEIKQYTPSLEISLSPLAATITQAKGCGDAACSNYDSEAVREAVDGADVVIVALGTGASLEEEDTDRPNLDLPGQQLQLLQDAAAAGKLSLCHISV